MQFATHLVLVTLVLASCGGGNQDLPSVDTNPIASQAELESLQKRKSDDKKVLEDEKSSTDKLLKELEAQINKLTLELSNSQDMSLQEREKIQKQLEEARREKQAAEDRLNQLKENQKRLEDDLAKAKTASQQSAAGTQSSTSTQPATSTGTSSSNGGIVTTTGTNTGSSSTTSTSPNNTSMNPSGIPSVGTAYSCSTEVVSTDGATRLQATFTGGTVPYIVHWRDMSGKLVQISSIAVGSSQIVNTTLGHAFQLMSPDGKSCYGRIKIGSDKNLFTVR